MNNELEIKISSSVEQANAKLDKLISKLNNGTTVTNNLTASATKLGKAFNLASIYVTAKKIANLFYNGINSINNYLETLNMFNLVMGDLNDQATKFQNTMLEAFGNDTQKQLEYQSYFQTLTESMGLQEKYAYIISENMTKMTYDISSLFDENQDDVASALRSGLVGQTKPVRNFGMDITENSLQPILDNLGIDRTVRELSQAEKEIVRYLALLQQSSIAHGDMANTIESPSNQLRVFKNQLVECQRWFSALFINTFAKAMPYINGVVMAIKEICKWLGTLFGIEISDYNTGIIEYYDDVEESVDDATDSIKELKRQVLKFDEINNINENSNSDSGYDTSGGIDQRLLDAITGYDNGMESVRMKATEIRDKIMEWLGFTKEVNEETGEITWKLKDGYTNLKKLRDILLAIGGLWGISKILKFGTTIANMIPNIINFGKAFSSLSTGINTSFSSLASTLGMTTGALAGVIAIIIAIAGALIYAYNTNDTFKTKVDELGGHISEVFTNIYNTIVNVFTQIWEVIEPIWNIFKDTIVSGVKGIYDTIVYYSSTIIDIINGTWNILSKLLDGDVKGAFEETGKLAETLNNNWEYYLGKIKDNFYDWKEKVVKNAEEFRDKFNEKLDGIVTWLEKLPNKAFYWFGKMIGSTWKLITETDWKQLGKDMIDKIFTGISDFNTKISTWASELYKKVKTTIANIDWKQVGKNVLAGIIKGMTDKLDTIKSWGESFLKGVKDALDEHSPSKLMIPVGAYVTLGIKEGMEDEIPNIENTALKMVDTLQSTFDEGMYDLSLESAMTPNFNQNVSNISTYKADTNIDYNMLEQASYNGFAKAIKQYGLVKIDVKQDKSSIVETAIEGINDITKQTGDCPIDVW